LAPPGAGAAGKGRIAVFVAQQTRAGKAAAPTGLVDRLDGMRSTRAVVLGLLPVFLLVQAPTSFNGNEYYLFMLCLQRLSPELFSPYSAVFDAANARILSEYAIGLPVLWLGYETAHAVLRLAMAGAYAASVGFFLSGMRLSVLDGLLVLAIFLVTGPDILGKEWLFGGVETKTFAYVLIFTGLGLAVRARPVTAVAAAACATYFHFLVGGFWAIAFIAYEAIRTRAYRRTAWLLLVYALAAGPLAAILAYQQIGASGVAHEPNASFIYSIFRNAHHVAPFASKAVFASWAPGVAALIGLSCSFLFLLQIPAARSKPLVPWVTGLLCYLLAALALSALDARTGHLGKFYLFRPSSLTLFCAIVALLGLFNELGDGRGIRDGLRKAVFFCLAPLALFVVFSEKAPDLSATRRAVSADIARMNDFIVRSTAPDDIVLVEPGGEYYFPKVALPMLIDRPTLVSFKYVPADTRDLFRWYDLVQYRDRVFGHSCNDIGGYPVRYLLMTRRPEMKIPCGKVVWQSDYFALVEP
jgi:hypothetical protein